MRLGRDRRRRQPFSLLVRTPPPLFIHSPARCKTRALINGNNTIFYYKMVIIIATYCIVVVIIVIQLAFLLLLLLLSSYGDRRRYYNIMRITVMYAQKRNGDK